MSRNKSRNTTAIIITRSVPQIIACVGVDEYRTTIQQEVRPGDAVPKVGWLSFGDYNSGLGSTKKLSETTTVLDTVRIGVDVRASIIKKAKERNSNVYFAVRDAWKTAELLRIQQNYFIEMEMTMDRPRVGFDIVFVDIGGLYGSDGLLESLLFLSSPSNALEPRYIVSL
jgi:hypothetical protein